MKRAKGRQRLAVYWNEGELYLWNPRRGEGRPLDVVVSQAEAQRFCWQHGVRFLGAKSGSVDAMGKGLWASLL